MSTKTAVETDFGFSSSDLSLALLEAFDAFERIQADLLLALQERPNSVLAQLHHWEEKRNKGRAVLCPLLDRLKEALKSKHSSRQEGEMWQGRLAQLMGREDEIYAALAQQRLRLEDELKKMRRGRQALNGYRSKSSGRRPVFCSQDA